MISKIVKILNINPIPVSINETMQSVLHVDHALRAVKSSPKRIAFSALLALTHAMTPKIPPMQEKINPVKVATIASVFQLVGGLEYSPP